MKGKKRPASSVAKPSGAKKKAGSKAKKKTAVKKSVAKKKAKPATLKQKSASRAEVKTSSKKSSVKQTARKKTRTIKSAAKKPLRRTGKKIKHATLKTGKKPAGRAKKTVPHVPSAAGARDDLEAKFVLGLPGLGDEATADSPLSLPDNYGDHRLVLIARDPRWVFCYWETDPAKRAEAMRKLGASLGQTHWNLRAYRLPADKKGAGALCADLGVDLSVGKCYLELGPPGAAFSAELGLMDQQGNFVAIVSSNTIELPADRPSESFDEQWALGENVQKAFYESLEGPAHKSAPAAGAKSMPSFGVSSHSRHRGAKTG